ncbi:hypothetical protein ELE36_13210 [Pseudolysobacter antarcticus]|uniref:Uncharacterized protein n=1 Tax=Pseudolysobacter antarcticus TaxID=2511995 RepID=A0A411HL29_9GAMM|nr:hypothetical protein [Pseudolysobacter antarcticus]QBB71236.1 hypothetical protein ELE36_13210 [Pseudolysobacter antarcticus]
MSLQQVASHANARQLRRRNPGRSSPLVLIALALGLACAPIAYAGNPTCPTPPCRPPNAHPPAQQQQQQQQKTMHSIDTAHAPNMSKTDPVHPLVMEKRSTIGPASPGPTHSISGASGASSKQGIIFVGGKNTLNTQPIPPGHSAQASVITPNAKPKPVAPKPVPKPGTGAH